MQYRLANIYQRFEGSEHLYKSLGVLKTEDVGTGIYRNSLLTHIPKHESIKYLFQTFGLVDPRDEGTAIVWNSSLTF
jgi:hypothetical protein